MHSTAAHTYGLFKARRNRMHLLIEESSFDVSDNWVVILFAGFETNRHIFRQESSFYYLTGIKEPGVVLVSFRDGRDFLYMPNYGAMRSQWVNTEIEPTSAYAKKFELNEIRLLGVPVSGYSFSPIFSDAEYQSFVKDLRGFLSSGTSVFTIFDDSSAKYLSQIQCCQYLFSCIPELSSKINDLSFIVDEMRRVKDNFEISQINQAVQITSVAHEVAASSIRQGMLENQIQAQIEHIFTSMGAEIAFPSIVATGKNTTVLHYTNRNCELQSGDLVVIDIGSEYGYYASDLTRTYPVSGKFSARQKEIYNAVLSVQEFVESIAKPGIFLKNSKYPQNSLHHLAVEFLEKLGYAKYFVHGIGHYLGLDVHDVGDYMTELQPGDVITIEPGIYIPEENIGVRIEDDYVIVDDGSVCLSSNLPRKPHEIEQLMKQS